MSYLLKALQKAEQERLQYREKDQSNQVIKVESRLPKSLLLIVFMLVVVTVWQLISGKQQVIEEYDLPSKVNHSDTINGSQSVSRNSTEKTETRIVGAASRVNNTADIKDELVEVKDLSQLSTNELSQIPSLELASHIYSSSAEFRSVVINGQTYREGMLIKAGIKLEEITQAGINISINGLLVSLPKGISWIASQNVK